jgi:hypothetical protein
MRLVDPIVSPNRSDSPSHLESTRQFLTGHRHEMACCTQESLIPCSSKSCEKRHESLELSIVAFKLICVIEIGKKESRGEDK